MAKTIVIIGTLDTKGEEVKYVKQQIEGRGHKTVVIDTSLLGEPAFPPDISHEELAEAVGADVKEIAAGDEGKAVTIIAEGAAKIAQQLHSAGRLDAIIALGGTMGTTLGLAVMRSLPLGVPKLMVSTAAFTPFIIPEMVSMDQVMMQCVADMWGLDTMTRRTLRSAAAAIAAMAETREDEIAQKPVIGVTTLGTSALKYVWHIKPLLQQKGYEVLVFHSVGTGGRAFERLIEQGVVAGALDLCMFEIVDHLYGGWCDAGPNRLEAAGRKGIPQVIAPGALHGFTVSCPPQLLPPRFRNRRVHVHNPRGVGVEMTKKEMVETAEVIAKKLNKATGPTVVLIPTRGFSEIDKPGRVFYNPKRLKAFAETLKEHIEPKIKVIELDMHINDPEFAAQAVAILDQLMGESSG